MKHKNQKLLFITAVLIILLVTTTPRIRAQGYPTGFDLRFEWVHLEEQSKDGQDVDVSQVGARMGYSLPQTFDLFVALSWQNIDARFAGNTIDFDPALAFRVGGKLYAVRTIPMGVPADFVLSLSYSTAKHKDKNTSIKYTHRRIISSAGLEWRYVETIPYMKIGVVYSELEEPSANYDQTSLLMAAGVQTPIMENVYLLAEINVCQEIGCSFGFRYMF